MKKEDFIYVSSILCSKWINKNKDPQDLKFESILIIKLDEIGDVVNSLHVFELLKKEYPTAKITLWCKDFIVPLISSDPNIDKIICSKKELEKKYDLIVDLRGNFDTIAFALMSNPKYRVERGGVRLHNKYNGGQRHEVITNLQIIEPLIKKLPTDISLNIYHTTEDIIKVDNFIKENTISKFVILHCSARMELRKWDANRFANIAKFLKEKYKFEIIFAGDKNDKSAIDLIQNKIEFKTFNIAGEFTLSGFATLASKANLFIGNESGPLHIATASKCKSLGLYGPGVPKTFYPWGKNATFIHHVLECNPCDQIHCVRPENSCMNLITEMEVQTKIKELLN